MIFCEMYVATNFSARYVTDSPQTELLDTFSEKESINFFPDENQSNEKIGFRDAAFVWSSDTDGFLTPSKRKFALRIEGDLVFKRGHMNLIIGPTGSGKTSLLMALLGMSLSIVISLVFNNGLRGEMHYLPSGSDSWYNLPRGSGIAYAAQESWVLNKTIKVRFML